MDCILHGYGVREQKRTAGFRLIAVQAYNQMAEKPLTAAEYLPLPAVDGPARPVVAAAEAEPFAAFVARMAARPDAPKLAE